MNIELSIVVPSYHTGAKLTVSLVPKLAVLNKLSVPFELILVLDGPDILAEQQFQELNKTNPQLILISLPVNMGKGHAVRRGMEVAKGNYIGYMDVDNDIDADILSQMYKAIRIKQADAILPSKRHPASKVNYPKSRKLFSTFYNIYVRYLLGLKISDTQLGAKLYRRELVTAVIPDCRINGFIFELEMLELAKDQGFNQFLEIPVKLNLETESTIGVGNSWRIIKETLWLTWNYKIKPKKRKPEKKKL